MNIITKAVTFFEDSQPDQAVDLLNNYMPRANDEEKAMIAELFFQWGFLEEASLILTNLIKKYPEENELKIMLADLYIENNQDEEAMLLLNEIPKNDEIYVHSLIQLADLYQAQGLFEVAEQKLLEAKQILPKEEVIDFALGELYFSTGDYKKAISYYERLNTKSIADVTIDERMAEAHASVGNYEEALEHYKSIELEKPDNLFKYGFTASRAGRNDIAINSWEKVIEKDPFYHSVFYELASVYQDEKMTEKAYETAIAGLKSDAFNKRLYLFAGTLAHQLNNDSESERWVSEAIALDPDYKDAVLFKVELLKEAEKYSSVIELIKGIQELGSTDPLYDWELARAYKEIESYNNALNHYDQAYNHFNKDADFLKEYGHFLIEEGRAEKGISILKSYLSFQPDDFEIEELIERFKQV